MYLRVNMMLTIVIQISIIYVIKSAAQINSEACNSCCTVVVPGIPGNHGNPGVSGPQGMNGEKGRNGLDGIPGKLGPQGLIGLPGTNGVKGEKGEQSSQKKSAFSVFFTSNPGRHDTSPMKYDTIITDVGNHYNKETGKFVCTIPGVYVFQVTSMKSSGSGKLKTRIMKNGNVQMSAQMDADGYNSASTMVVLDLVSGDEVWTQPGSPSYNYYHSSSLRYCSFSGFLLYAA
ncbi:complement C1q tumor necrosis factor-related protein 2-like [Antedon mediterranea]|uniref:complement C1q tumor necrosis factor-related protein 2-like n=1 Tax=Antedon mediterranea TaxID=105859 RepID=UPI003AF7F05B